MKDSKNIVAKILLIVAVVLILLSIFVAISFAWFRSGQANSGSINTGNIDFTIIGNLEPLASEDSKIIAGDIIENPISIVNQVEGVDVQRQEDMLLRFFVNATIDGKPSDLLLPNFVNADDWARSAQDGGYYYLGVVGRGQSLDLISGILVSDELKNSLAGQDVSLKIEIDGIQYRFEAYKSLWQDAPPLWVQYIEEL